MTPLVEGLLNSVRHQLTEKGAEARIDGPLPDMVSDRVAIEQVLGNLIDNAVKYLSPKRPGRIAVRAEAVGARVVIEVEDNGRGIDPPRSRAHLRAVPPVRGSGPSRGGDWAGARARLGLPAGGNDFLHIRT